VELEAPLGVDAGVPYARLASMTLSCARALANFASSSWNAVIDAERDAPLGARAADEAV